MFVNLILKVDEPRTPATLLGCRVYSCEGARTGRSGATMQIQARQAWRER
jgi:hypothetical protein